MRTVMMTMTIMMMIIIIHKSSAEPWIRIALFWETGMSLSWLQSAEQNRTQGIRSMTDMKGVAKGTLLYCVWVLLFSSAQCLVEGAAY